VLTSNGNPYSNWQTEIFYYWYQKARERDPGCDMGGFTRLLHARHDDHLSAKIPTVRVDPIGHHGVMSFPPLQRPDAFKKLLDGTDFEEDYILMAEPDHVLMEAIPNWATETEPATFPFFYISFTEKPDIVKKWNKKNVPLSDLYPIGNSPTLIHKAQFKALLEVWPQLTIEMFEDAETKKAWGWVLEMYAFAFSASLVGDKPIKFTLRPDFMLQPPWDTTEYVKGCTPPQEPPCKERKAYIIHYTYGMDYDREGKFTPGKIGTGWRFDKRQYMGGYPPKALPMPMPSVNATNPLVYKFMGMMKEAIDSSDSFH